MTGSGDDIEGTADEFRFVYRQLAGDCELTARVVSQQDTHDWAKAGVMIRQTLEPGSMHAMCITTPGNGAAFQRRTGPEGATLHTGADGLSTPRWVLIRRSGNVLAGFSSGDGVTWTQIGSDTFSMGDPVYAGLAVTSHNDQTLCTVTFDHVSFTMDPCVVDLNADGRVNLADISQIAGEWQTSQSPIQGDLNTDGAVNLEDIALLLNAWLRACLQ